VYLRYLTQTMSGTNPDGSHYADPGIPWISYFDGSSALHGFIRATYGWPQSLGCVEMPFASAPHHLAAYADRHPGHRADVLARYGALSGPKAWRPRCVSISTPLSFSSLAVPTAALPNFWRTSSTASRSAS